MRSVRRGTSQALWRNALYTNVLFLTLALMHPDQTYTRAQSQRAQAEMPAFEVVSVRPSSPGQREINGFYTYPGGRIVGNGCILQYLIMIAYNVQDFQISGGPNWINGERFDVQAKPPDSSTSARWKTSSPRIYPGQEERQMLQTMLADRFQLQVHHATKEGSIYVLTRGTGDLKLTPSKDKNGYPWAGGIGGLPDVDGIRGKNISMPEFATRVSEWLKRPVIDETGIQGSFDFEFRTGENDRDSSFDLDTSILTSIKGIGLRLKPSKGPVETIVVDHAEQPSPN